LTVTVIGGTATFADAVSTALLCMGSERATDFINQNLADYKICMTVKNGESLQLLTNVNQAFELVASDYSIADFTGE
jgi:thiamine biosynthesis lipoprotein ApbE